MDAQQQCGNLLPTNESLCSQSSPPHLLWSDLFIFPQFNGSVVYFWMVLICISLITMSLEVRYLFTCLLIICIFFFILFCKLLFLTFSFLCTGCCHFLVDLQEFLYILDINYDNKCEWGDFPHIEIIKSNNQIQIYNIYRKHT